MVNSEATGRSNTIVVRPVIKIDLSLLVVLDRANDGQTSGLEFYWTGLTFVLIFNYYCGTCFIKYRGVPQFV
jgi:hypothetical protein